MWTEELLDQRLTAPTPDLVEDMRNLQGDILILGAGGKMGPSLAVLAQNALRLAGNEAKVIAVSRFSDPIATDWLKSQDIILHSADLLTPGAVEALPDAPNVIYMAGKKFGTEGQEAYTWAMNTYLPAQVGQKYQKSRIVAFSSGNIYPMMPLHSAGATEQTPPCPIGDYAMSCLGRERMFEYAAKAFGAKVLLYRLNYAVDLRYGVLWDIAQNLLNDQPISLATPVFNCIWQGDANAMALRALLYADNPAVPMNITGPETVSVRHAAEQLGHLLDKTPIFTGEPSQAALLSNAEYAFSCFGYPTVSFATLLTWQAEWILSGGRSLHKPTHFEERQGKF